ncbi:MAG: hypothetical protein PF450_07470 [Bacteroidales bacterium]|jgi:hypothetical protein|nr:hypothetical protein [Bacteroidales bacterium]
MKKKLLVLAVFISAATFSFAQDYTTGIGLRGGLSNGVTIRHFIGETTAVEGLIQTRWSGFSLTGLYELQRNDAWDVDRLNWYYGVGAHVGMYNSTDYTWANTTGSVVVLGIDAILGIEYNFEEIPINISADWKPAINVIGGTKFWPDGGALSIRYIF